MERAIVALSPQKPQALLAIFWAGLLGPRTYRGGIATSAFGLLCHFVIAYSAASVFYWASRYIPFLLQYALVSGALYGIAVYFFMNRIVVPLSAATKMPFSLKMMFIGIIIHIFCVGMPISLTIRRFSPQ